MMLVTFVTNGDFRRARSLESTFLSYLLEISHNVFDVYGHVFERVIRDLFTCTLLREDL